MLVCGSVPTRAIKNLTNQGGCGGTTTLELRRLNGTAVPEDSSVVIVVSVRPGQMADIRRQIEELLLSHGGLVEGREFTD